MTPRRSPAPGPKIELDAETLTRLRRDYRDDALRAPDLEPSIDLGLWELLAL